MPNKTGDFDVLKLTNAGRDMLTQGRAGHVLTFTKIVIGDGTATGAAIDNLIAIKSPKLTLPIAKNETVHAGQMRLQFRVSNSLVDTSFYFREIGLMAKVDNGEEKLYAYTTCGDKAKLVYDKTYPIQEKIINIDTVTDNAVNVKVILDLSIMYATQKDIIDMIKPHKELAELDHPDESVTTRKLRDKSVTLPKLADDVNELLQKTYVKKSGDTMTGNLTLANNGELLIAATGGNHSISNTGNNLNLGNPSITKESNLCSKNRPSWDNGTDKKLIALEENVINETRKYLPLTGGYVTGDIFVNDNKVLYNTYTVFNDDSYIIRRSDNIVIIGGIFTDLNQTGTSGPNTIDATSRRVTYPQPMTGKLIGFSTMIMPSLTSEFWGNSSASALLRKYDSTGCNIEFRSSYYYFLQNDSKCFWQAIFKEG